MCEEFKLTKWSEELIKNRLKHQCKLNDNAQLNTIISVVNDIVKNRNLYHSEKDFPKNSDELGKLWLSGYTNGLKVGDRVQFKYILNVDGAEDEDIKMLRSCQDEFAIITGFKNRIKGELAKHVTVDFANEELVELNDYLFLPMQFIKVTRGLRAKANIIDEVCDIDKIQVKEVLSKFDKTNENNIYLTQKERNVIRCDIERTLHSFENQVDSCLRDNELQLAKVNHNVVDTARGILDKLQFADYEDLENSKYYLTIDLDRQGENKAILFHQYENKLKIDKFIDFYERDFTKIAKKLINEIKPYKNGKIIIPNVVFGQNLIDFIKAEGFEDIIELDLKDLNKCNIYNLELFNDKNKIYNLSDVNIGGNEYHTGFIRLKKQLDNLVIKTNTEGSSSRFDMKDKDIDKYWIICVFYTLYKLGYKL